MNDILWWAKFILKRLVILGIMVAAAWYTIQGRKPQPPPAEQVQQQEQTPPPEQQTVDLVANAMQKMSPEQQAEMKEIGLDKGSLSVEVISPAAGINASINKKSAAIRNTAVQVHAGYLNFLNYFVERWNDLLELLKTLFAIVLLGMLCMRVFKLFEPLRIFSLFLLKLSNALLIIVSTVALIMTCGFNANLWRDFNFVIFWIPIGLLLAGAVGSWTIDDNFPMWKALSTAMAFPLASGLGIIIKGLLF